MQRQNASELKKSFSRKVEEVISYGKEATLLPLWLQNETPESLRSRPVILCGYNVMGSIYHDRLTQVGFNTVDLMEDRRIGDIVPLGAIHAIKDLPKVAKKYNSPIVLNAITHNHDDHKRVQDLCNTAGIPCLNTYQLDAYLRWNNAPRFNAVLEPEYFVDSVLSDPDGFMDTEKYYQDEESKRNLWGILLGRITMDNKYFDMLQTDAPRQYFPDFFDYSGHQTLIDAGALDGADTEDFLRHVKPDARSIIFELEAENAQVCENTAQRLRKEFAFAQIEVRQLGLWSERSMMAVEYSGSSARLVFDKAAPRLLPVVDLDSQVDKASLIKLEIEGAELPALKGADRVIRSSSPNLSISAYHRASDLIELPRHIESLDLGYTQKLRHHTPWWSFSVLYSVKRRNHSG